MKNIKTIFSYMVVAALVAVLSISCKNEDKTGGGSGGGNLDSIPTASGTEATASELTAYNGKTYTGTIGSGVTRKSFNSNPQEFGEQFSVEEAQGGQVSVYITDNKISYIGGSGAQVQIYKSADGKYIASEDTNLEGFRYKSYIQINSISATEITFYLFMGMSGSGNSFTAEYEGTLTVATE